LLGFVVKNLKWMASTDVYALLTTRLRNFRIAFVYAQICI